MRNKVAPLAPASRGFALPFQQEATQLDRVAAVLAGEVKRLHAGHTGALAVVLLVVHEEAARRVEAKALAEQLVDGRVGLHEPLEGRRHPAVEHAHRGHMAKLLADARGGIGQQVDAIAGLVQALGQLVRGLDGVRVLGPVGEALGKVGVQPLGQVRPCDARDGLVRDGARVEQRPLGPAKECLVEKLGVLLVVSEVVGEELAVEPHEHVSHVEHDVLDIPCSNDLLARCHCHVASPRASHLSYFRSALPFLAGSPMPLVILHQLVGKAAHGAGSMKS